MRTGRLSIRRGEAGAAAAEETPAHLTLVPQGAGPVPAPPQLPASLVPAGDYPAAARLGALERLVGLYEHGALTPAEFAAEKRLILGPAPDEPAIAPVHFVPAGRRPARAPSLLGKLLGWRFLLVGLVAGLALSFATQPAATLGLFRQLGRAIGF